MDHEDTLVKPNMTPMIDVVFQLLIFFLVNMKFKTLDMKIEAFLPKERGVNPIITDAPDVVKVTARLSLPDGEKRARLKLDGRVIGYLDDPAVWPRVVGLVAAAKKRHTDVGADPEKFEGEIDASPLVATGAVVRTIDAFVDANVAKVTFKGAPPPR